uniref:CCHC-type domain-containing protein n=1 Tax=Photinus pyralis TaxID=7054 RepID=A0A1Y1NEP2_PHOPY
MADKESDNRDVPVEEQSGLQDSEGEEVLPSPKRARVQWQEKLIDLLATQQQQLDELTRQSKMAITASPTPSVVETESLSAHATASCHVRSMFKLTSYDPDASAYSIEEWLADATKLKHELNVSDLLMIAKAGEALKNRGQRYFCDWRPLCRNWENFCGDLIIAFPDRETPGSRAYRAATLRSRECDSLCEYGNQKLRSIARFYDNLPWTTILSMVAFGLDREDVRSALHIQKPTSDRELMKVLSEFDARLNTPSNIRKHSEVAKGSGWKSDRHTREDHPDMTHGKAKLKFQGLCFKCGRQGHRQALCRSYQTKASSKEEPPKIVPIDTEPGGIPSCTYCKKMGHTEPKCYFKHGKKAFILKK